MTSQNPTRRDVLTGIAVGAVTVTTGDLLFQPARATTSTGPVTLDEFMDLSDILTDNEFSLRDEVGSQYLVALNADPAHAGPLRQLVQDTVRAEEEPDTFDAVLRSGALDTEAAAATAQQILAYWYSGLIAGREDAVDYVEALAWETLEFTEPRTEKVGFPKWEDMP
ncbi:MAG TPA: sugar dehydrogenase complex small subunit [Nocardioides sp.]|nr:sugar dehydrogenase complex small subunit [Nocardioides sp.]